MKVGVGTVGLGQENLVIVGDGVLKLSQFLSGKAPGEEGVYVTGLQLEDPIIFNDGFQVST